MTQSKHTDAYKFIAKELWDEQHPHMSDEHFNDHYGAELAILKEAARIADALEQYKQPQVSNEEALMALAIISTNLKTCTNVDYSHQIETILAALTAPRPSAIEKAIKENRGKSKGETLLNTMVRTLSAQKGLPDDIE